MDPSSLVLTPASAHYHVTMGDQGADLLAILSFSFPGRADTMIVPLGELAQVKATVSVPTY